MEKENEGQLLSHVCVCVCGVVKLSSRRRREDASSIHSTSESEPDSDFEQSVCSPGASCCL